MLIVYHITGKAQEIYLDVIHLNLFEKKYRPKAVGGIFDTRQRAVLFFAQENCTPENSSGGKWEI